jgi:hypothetical protein
MTFRWPSRAIIAAGTAGWLLALGACGRSHDVSGHNTYQSQSDGAAAAAATARDTAADSAAPRVRP